MVILYPISLRMPTNLVKVRGKCYASDKYTWVSGNGFNSLNEATKDANHLSDPTNVAPSMNTGVISFRLVYNAWLR
jgi:hypothetical protein